MVPRGGYRPGAGRPRKVPVPPENIQQSAADSGMSPLDYMLGVMRDGGADPGRRDRMAIAAAPYVHPKPSEVAPGKKAEAELASLTAERGSDWEQLLN